ncbi:MAG: hypothetical protein GY950_33840, partial [bacterium]|nr:hypothetical protein [bacterium]
MEEIENRLLVYEGVKEAVVQVKGEASEDRYLCAYIVAGHLEMALLKEYLTGQLPHYMVPANFVQLEKMPLTASGKIDRRALSAYRPARAALSGDYTAPAAGVEKEVAEIWKQVLQLEEVGIYDNFFEIGGNSLNILKVRSQLKEILAIDIPVVKLFKYPTIYSLSLYLDKASREENPLDNQLALAKKITMGKDRLKERVSVTGKETPLDIAVIGMAGVFPGAKDT